MMIPLSDREAAILLGATLMHWGVPFHRAAKQELTGDRQATVDAASEKLIALREDYRESATQPARSVSLTGPEIALLSEVVDECLAECGDDATELSLHLKAGAREEVQALVNRLQGGADGFP